ncbi:MAG TPA: hypothetical protein VMA71_07255 [Alloacidobacterium sp.]|nr:hypothetical protein [Alloacidobacterium sp.]
MRHATFQKILWWLCLLVAPLVLVVIELFHPAGFTIRPGMYQYLSKPEAYDPQFKALAYFGPHWWFTLHMIQTPMVALVAIGLWMLAGLTAASTKAAVLVLAWLSRVATFVFLIYYTALDSIGGSGLGRTILNTQSLASQGKLTADQVSGVQTVLNTTWIDPWVGGVGSVISLTGSWAVFFAALFLAISLFLDKKISWIPALLLVAFGWELQVSHTMPNGPIAFALLIVAGIWIWRTNRQPATS